MPRRSWPGLVLVVLGALSCGKDKANEVVPADVPPRNARWQYLESMLEAQCACQGKACSDEVYARAERDGYRYLPAQLLEEDKPSFSAVVNKPGPCSPSSLALQARARRDLVKIQLARIINGSYPRWATTTQKICPETLSELDRYRSDKSIKDPWGRDLLMLCGESAPADAAVDFGVLSLGPDGKRGTEDDVQSWNLSP